MRTCRTDLSHGLGGLSLCLFFFLNSLKKKNPTKCHQRIARCRSFFAHESCILFRQRNTRASPILIGPRALDHALATCTILSM